MSSVINLTQLDGFEPTKLETLVAGNPSFQFLRQRGWPYKWGQRITGRQFNANHAKDLTSHVSYDQAIERSWKELGQSLTPSAVAAQFDELAPHVRSVLVLASKIWKEAGADPFDRELVGDLSLWLDQPEYPFSDYGFRWERHEQGLKDKAEHKAWIARVAELRQGEVEVLAILQHRLRDAELEEIRDLITEKWLKKTAPSTDEDSREYRLYRDAHLPQLRCLECPIKNLHHGFFGSAVTKKEVCQHAQAILVVDPGGITEIIALIPRALQDHVRTVRFRLPRSTFRAPKKPQYDQVFPHLFLIGLERLNEAAQLGACGNIEAWLKCHQENSKAFHVGLMGNEDFVHSSTQLIKPYGSEHLNAVLLAGNDMEELTWSHTQVSTPGIACYLEKLAVTVSFTDDMWMAAQGKL